MKTKILILFVLIFSFASSCEPEEVPANNCNCEKVYYTYTVRLDGVIATWYYKKDYAEPVECTNETVNYIQIDSNKFYKIECE